MLSYVLSHELLRFSNEDVLGVSKKRSDSGSGEDLLEITLKDREVCCMVISVHSMVSWVTSTTVVLVEWDGKGGEAGSLEVCRHHTLSLSTM